MPSVEVRTQSIEQTVVPPALLRIAVCGGATAGHVTPGIAIAEEVRRISPQAVVEFLGHPDQFSQSLLDSAEIPYHKVISPQFSKRRVSMRLRSIPKMLVGFRRARKILKSLCPTLAIGLGGYASIPGILAAKSLGIPVVLHEANVIPGLANRTLSRLADLVCVSFPETVERFPQAKRVDQVGIPIRKQQFENASNEAAQNSTNDESTRILITGGTIGSSFLNQHAPELINQLIPTIGSVSVVHQTGRDCCEEIRDAYAKSSLSAEVHSHISTLTHEFRNADFVITTGGAITLAELEQSQVPTLVVPLEWSANDHQTWNAKQFCQGREDRLYCQESDWELESLCGQIKSAISARKKRSSTSHELDPAQLMLAKIDNVVGAFT